MCGIFCTICPSVSNINSVSDFELITELLKRRGPDHYQEVIVKAKDGNVRGIFCATVLHLRGLQTERQPLIDSDGNILLWNGEIFDGIEVSTRENDGKVLISMLQRVHEPHEIISLLSAIQGPWAFVYWQSQTSKVWFGRDFFGRRSLLCSYACEDNLILSSVAHRPIGTKYHKWAELPADGIYCMNVDSSRKSINNVVHYAWNSPHNDFELLTMSDEMRASYDQVFTAKPHTLTQNTSANNSGFSNEKESIFHVETSGLSIPNPLKYALNMKMPSTEMLDELFPTQSATKITSGQKISKKQCFSDMTQLLRELLKGKLKDIVDQYLKILDNAVSMRIITKPVQCRSCNTAERQPDGFAVSSTSQEVDSVAPGIKQESTNCLNNSSCQHSKVAVLFSGGLDSTVLCALADKHVPLSEPIDLMNVAFELKAPSGSQSFSVPDRQTGLQALEELKKMNPLRMWNFVEINIDHKQLQHESEHIHNLVYPLTTVMDSDIGCAIWFAARGRGVLKNGNPPLGNYISPAKIIFTGMGADEQLAGYSRHHSCFHQHGWLGLLQELQMEINRISSRNLGRDDRVIADHGREARFPFLDEKVVSFLNSIPIYFKANLKLPRGIGDKLLLRLAALQLGLPQTAVQVKRAIQFGTRIANFEGKRKGTDIAAGLVKSNEVSVEQLQF